MRLDCSLTSEPRTIEDVLGRSTMAICVFSGVAFAQEIGPTEYAPCLEKQVGTRYLESDLLVSGDRLWQAFAKVETKPVEETGCGNTSALYVHGPGAAAFQPIYTIKPEPSSEGNGIKPISWSARGHRLAIEVSAWPYGGTDAFFTWLLVYDADSRRVLEPDLPHLFARKYGKRECDLSSVTDVLGFDSRDRVLFETDDFRDGTEDEPAAETRCVGAPTVWALDLDTNQLELVRRLQPQDVQ